MSLLSQIQRLVHPTSHPPTKVVDQHLTSIKEALDGIAKQLQRWPPPPGLSKEQMPALQERQDRLQRELNVLAKSTPGPRTAHALMRLGEESQALAVAAGLAQPAPPPDLDGEGETAQDARWFEQERRSQDRLRTLEARQQPALFKHQIRRAERAGAEVATAMGKSSAAGRGSPLEGGMLSRHRRAGAQLDAAVAAHPQVVATAAALRQRMEALSRRDDAHAFADELREVRAQVAASEKLGRAKHGGWHQAAVAIAGARTWLDRLDADLARVDAMPRGWRDLITDRRALAPAAREAVERRAFHAARLMTAEHCDPREAMAMALRAEQAIAAGCPATSALVNERVRRALAKHPQGIVAPLVSMLRMTGTADVPDALAVLQPMTRLPAAFAQRLADAGVTLLPSPGNVDNANPRSHLEPTGDHADGFFSPATRQIVVKTLPGQADGTSALTETTVPLHEAAHAYEHTSGAITHKDPHFLAARQRDVAAGHMRPGKDDYFLASDKDLHGDPKEETHVESLAMYLVGNRRWPALHDYWQHKLGPKARS